MGTLGIISLILGVLGLAAGVGTSVYQNNANTQAVKDTNEANLQAVRETNASNVQQAEFAYQRSLPINQVNNLVAAGMSKSAAINSLSGGGTYQAPVLQSAHADAPQVDYSGVASAMERLGNIPSNAEQYNIQQQQRKNLEQEFMLREKEEQRKQEMHDYNIWRERYNKQIAELLDGVSSKVVQFAADKGYDLSSAKSVQQIMRDLGLENDKDYQTMPHIARLQLFDAIKSQNEQRISQESHESNMRKAALEESILQSNLKQMAEEYQNSVKEHRTQDKERLVREGRATLENILLQNNINQEEFLRSIRFDQDGNPNLVTRTKSYFKEAWSLIGSVLPIDYLGDILRGLVVVSPK